MPKPIKPLPDRVTSARFDHLGNVMFHCNKAALSLEYAISNLDRAAACSVTTLPALEVAQQRAALVAAVTSQNIVWAFARDERSAMRAQFNFGY